MSQAASSASSRAVVLRSLCFHAASGAVTLGFLLLYPLIIAPRWFVWAVLKRYVAIQSWLLAVICGLRYRVERLEAVPEEPCILASRHEALWETLVLPLIFDNPAVFLKEDILRYPFAGQIAAKLGMIGVDRGGALDAIRRSLDDARRAMGEGRRILIFPSGTRDPARRDQVQGGVAVLYRALSVPIVPITLDSGTFWPHRSWLRHPGEITVRILPAIPPGLPTAELLERLKEDLSHPGPAPIKGES